MPSLADMDTDVILNNIKSLFQSGSQGQQMVDEILLRTIKANDDDDIETHTYSVDTQRGFVRPRRHNPNL